MKKFFISGVVLFLFFGGCKEKETYHVKEVTSVSYTHLTLPTIGG